LSESFDDVAAEPADAVTALRAVLERAADGIHRRTIEAENAAREVVGSGTDAGARLGRLAEWGIWLTGAQGAFPPRPLERVTLLSVGLPAPVGHPVHQLAPASGVSMSSVALPTDSTSAQLAELGVVAVDAAIDVGCDLLVLPALVDDTVSSALVALLLRLSATEVTGESPHLDDRQWAEHVADIRDRTHDARRYDDDPVALLDALGSPELVALVAMLLRAAARRTPVLLDGAADCAGALCASRVSILGSWWWFAAASSSNPATTRAIEALGLEPLVHLGSLLDGGAAALTALPLLRAAQQLCGTP
jgi:nicotinate-nucleotide--dimethylbenzimidazole phosphoribosyltransferase